MVQLTKDQKDALNTLFSWFNSKQKSPFITLGGYAGTGKTTVIALLRKLLNVDHKTLKVSFCSYTGKGAQVLKDTLIKLDSVYSQDTVGTIHSLIYSPYIDGNGEILGWNLKDELKTDLIIVDEASMVDQKVWLDLVSYGIPIIAVGDHGQLPPINDSFNLLSKPMLRLEQIHRQASENPIIALSLIARETGYIPAREYSEKVVKYSYEEHEAQDALEDAIRGYNTDTLILCGYNNTRLRVNSFVRQEQGFELEEPQPGDRVICLRNNHEKEIFNGMQGDLTNIFPLNEEWYHAEIEMDMSLKPYEGRIAKKQFNSAIPLNFTKNRRDTVKGDLFDFGYCLTVHKAQGSEANKVILFEERFKKASDEVWKRWLYTGVTRAIDELFIIGA